MSIDGVCTYWSLSLTNRCQLEEMSARLHHAADMWFTSCFGPSGALWHGSSPSSRHTRDPSQSVALMWRVRVGSTLRYVRFHPAPRYYTWLVHKWHVPALAVDMGGYRI